jgi:hypothetical protein
MNLSEDGVALTDNFEEARVVVGSFNARFESQWTRIDGRNKLDSPNAQCKTSDAFHRYSSGGAARFRKSYRQLIPPAQ